jgi:hypothetical protein
VTELIDINKQFMLLFMANLRKGFDLNRRNKTVMRLDKKEESDWSIRFTFIIEMCMHLISNNSIDYLNPMKWQDFYNQSYIFPQSFDKNTCHKQISLSISCQSESRILNKSQKWIHWRDFWCLSQRNKLILSCKELIKIIDLMNLIAF